MFSAHSKTLVHRLGGTSHEVVVMEVEHGMYRTVAKVSDNQFGGDVFTQVLQNFLMSEFNRLECASLLLCHLCNSRGGLVILDILMLFNSQFTHCSYAFCQKNPHLFREVHNLAYDVPPKKAKATFNNST